jgi:hypothetical protein
MVARLLRWKERIENLFSNESLKRRCELGIETGHWKDERRMQRLSHPNRPRVKAFGTKHGKNQGKRLLNHIRRRFFHVIM